MPAGFNFIRGDGCDGNGIRVIPEAGYNRTLIWLHGLGDTAAGWHTMMPLLGIRRTKFILPTAPIRQVRLDDKISKPAWHQVKPTTFPSENVEDEYEFDQLQRVFFEESLDRIKRIVDNEIQKFGIRPKQIAIGGFDQGGSVALHAAIRSGHSFSACVGINTVLPFQSDYDESNYQFSSVPLPKSSKFSISCNFSKTYFLLCVGEKDPIFTLDSCATPSMNILESLHSKHASLQSSPRRVINSPYKAADDKNDDDNTAKAPAKRTIGRKRQLFQPPPDDDDEDVSYDGPVMFQYPDLDLATSEGQLEDVGMFLASAYDRDEI